MERTDRSRENVQLTAFAHCVGDAVLPQSVLVV